MIEDVSDDQLTDIDVDMFQYAEALAPQTIGTIGLNGCIGIAVMDDQDAWAWVLHSPNLTNVDGDFRTLIKSIGDERSAGHDLRVVLLGGDDSCPIERSDVRAARRLVETAIKDFLPAASVKTGWGLLGHGFKLEHDGRVWNDELGHPLFET